MTRVTNLAVVRNRYFLDHLHEYVKKEYSEENYLFIYDKSNNQVLFWCQIGQLDGYYAMQVADPVDQKREFVDDILSRMWRSA